MSKKGQRNGFWYFMQDYRDKEIKNGREFPNGLKDVQADPKCSAEWNALTAEAKTAYNNRAKNEPRNGRIAGKQTGLGEDRALLDRQKQEQAEYEKDMKANIQLLIKAAVEADKLDKQSFYFIHVNHFYTKTSMDSTVDYIPAEFAVIEFSLGEGAIRKFHRIMKVNVETGYTREALEHSDSTHRLPFDVAEGVVIDATLYNDFVKFLEPGCLPSGKFPPLYTSKKMKTIVPCLLQRLTNVVKKDSDMFDLYSLEYLLGVFMLHLNDKLPESSNIAILAEAQLAKGAFTWTPDIECFWHLGMDEAGPYCSQSIVRQWAFTFCDYCCPKLGMDMTRGVHCPSNTALSTTNSEYGSVVSSIRSMSIKVDQGRSRKMLSSLKSDTGVTEAYRHEVSTRSRADNERRKKEAMENNPLTIIDHSKLPKELPIINESAYVPAASQPPAKPRHTMLGAWGNSDPASKTSQRLRQTLANAHMTDDVPEMNDMNFPAFGRGRPRQ